MSEMRRGWYTVLVAALLLTPAGLVAAQGEGDEALPDLKAADLEAVPEEPAPGDNVTLHATVENGGDANASAFNVTFHVDGEQIGDAVAVAGLAAGEEIELSSDNWTAKPGEHAISVHADADNQIAEDDEENNVETEDVDIEQPQADDASDDASEDDEADDADDEDEAEADDDGDKARNRSRALASSFEADNGTYTGDHVRFVLDEELPGIRAYTILDGDAATVFDEITLPNATEVKHHAVRDVFAMKAGESELMLRDRPSYHLSVETDAEADVRLTAADGVNVTENTTYTDDDEDEAVYELALDDNRTLYLFGEDLTYENGTFSVGDEARLSARFPPGGGDAEERRERIEERREAMQERREERRQAGSQWDEDNGTYTGGHVAFTVDAENPGLAGYAIIGSRIPVFAAVALPGGNETERKAHGASFELETESGQLKILDVPPAVLIVEADDGDHATLELADGVNATPIDRGDGDDEDGIYRLELSGNRTGWLVGDDLTLDNGTFAVSDRAIFRTVPVEPGASPNRGPGSLPDAARERGGDESGDDGDERGPPDHARAHALDNRARMQVEEAIARGRVAAEVHVGPNATEPVAVEMGDVQVRNAWIGARGPSRAGMTIEAPDGTPGTTVTLSLDEGKLGNVSLTDAGAKLAVKFDNETIPMADDLDDVLDPDDDNGTAEYLLLVGGDKVEVLVSVPHFSPHTVEVYETQSQEEAATNGTPGFTALAVVAATGLAAAVATVRKNRK